MAVCIAMLEPTPLLMCPCRAQGGSAYKLPASCQQMMRYSPGREGGEGGEGAVSLSGPPGAPSSASRSGARASTASSAKPQESSDLSGRLLKICRGI